MASHSGDSVLHGPDRPSELLCGGNHASELRNEAPAPSRSLLVYVRRYLHGLWTPNCRQQSPYRDETEFVAASKLLPLL
jgi:hypothetical protein